MPIRFEWDVSKARSNLRKHGVAFYVATTAFFDALSVTIPDPEHSVGEQRFLLIGATLTGRLVVVAHTDRGGKFESLWRDVQATGNEQAMKGRESDKMRPNYDFSAGIRGKYVQRLAKGANVVVLDRDVAKIFPTSKAVNDALRVLAAAGKRHGKAKGGRRSA